MKKLITSIALSLLLIISLTACGNNTSKTVTTNKGTKDVVTTTEAKVTTTVKYNDAVTDAEINAEETTDVFSLTTEVENGYTTENNVYTITVGGEYTATGLLEGQILIDSADDVVLNLSGATIVCDFDSPIKSVGDGELTISAKKGTDNVVKDTRSTKTVDDSSQGAGAIYAKSDLKIQGKGTLVVSGSYNNGIHTKDDLKIKNLSLKVTAFNNGIKANDSFTMESGTVVIISTNGDGIKTENTDISSKGKQRGTVEVCGGTLVVYAAGDGIQASYNFVMGEDSEDTPTSVAIYTGSYSGYTSSSSTCDSFKGVKAENEINISGGSILLNSYDDGLHANYGTAFENGESGLGNINISGGSVTTTVYSPNKSTAGGMMGPGRPGGAQQEIKGADGMHADNTINITGGLINIDSAFEGIEANFINISGGETYVYGTDDGLNASNKINKTPAITISGGYLDITISTGDTDGIDSNGTYTQTGGVVISRGAPNSSNNMATGLDCDGAATISGGTFVQFGPTESKLTKASGATVYKLNFGSSQQGMGGRPGGQSSQYTFTSGSWYLSSNQELFTAVLEGNYYGCTIYSADLSSGSYTITNGQTSYTASTTTL